MNKNTYCFSTFTDDTFLSNLADEAKALVQENDNIFHIFNDNYEMIGQSLKQALFLMQLSKQSIFSPTSSKDKSTAKSTPTKRNPGTLNMRRTRLTFDIAENKDQYPATPEFSTPLGLKKPSHPAFEAITNPSVTSPSVKTGICDASLASSTCSTDISSQESSPTTVIRRMTTNLTMTEKDIESPVKLQGRNASSEESSPTTVIAKMTTNLTMTEKDIESPDASGQESSPTTVITRMTTDLTMTNTYMESPGASGQESSTTTVIDRMTTDPTMTEKNIESPVKVQGRIYARSQESSPTTAIATITTNLTTTEKDFECSVKLNDRINTSSQESSPTMAKKRLKSPIKEVGSIHVENQESFRSVESSRIASMDLLSEDDNELRKIIEDNQQAGNSTTNNDSPNPDKIPSKSENPDLSKKYANKHAKGRHTAETVVITSGTLSPGEGPRICIIPPSDTQESTSHSKQGRIVIHSPENNQQTINRRAGNKLNASPIEKNKKIARDDRKRKSLSPTRKSKTPFKTVPKVIKLECEEEMAVEVVDLEYGASPTTSQRKSAEYKRDYIKDSSFLSHGESRTDTSPKTPELPLHFSERVIADSSSRNISGNNSPDIEANPTLLKSTIQKFDSLLVVRDESMKKSFISCHNFQSCITYTKNYVLAVMHILNKIDLSEKCSSEELKKIVRHATAISDKLLNKLKSWEKDIDLNIYARQKCFQKIEQLQAKYEPLFTNEGEPVVAFESMKVYEDEMKALWKEMDGLVMLGDSRRVLFDRNARDIERLIKILVKGLILVGILQTL